MLYFARGLCWLSWGLRLLGKHLGPSSSVPWACCNLRCWFFYDFLPCTFARGPSSWCCCPCVLSTSIYLLLPLNDLANPTAAGLSQTAYDFTLVCHFVDGDSLQLLPEPAAIFTAGFFTTRFLARGLSCLARSRLGDLLAPRDYLLLLPGLTAIFAADFLSFCSPAVLGCLVSTW